MRPKFLNYPLLVTVYIRLQLGATSALRRRVWERRSPTQRRTNRKLLPIARRPAVVVVRVFCVRAFILELLSLTRQQAQLQSKLVQEVSPTLSRTELLSNLRLEEYLHQ